MDLNSILSSAGEIFQGVGTLVKMLTETPAIGFARIGLILLGLILIYLGKKGILEPLLMIPMGLGMATVNAAFMFFDPINILSNNPPDPNVMSTLFVDSTISDPSQLIGILQINWLQPIYTLTFSNGLIACLVFMGIGSLLDVGFVMARPFQSMIIALFAEVGTIITFPLAQLFGMTAKEAASVAVIGGADGPMVLFTSLQLAPHLFVPIAVVAYLYLGLAYGGFPFLVRAMIPKKLIGIVPQPPKKVKEITSAEKMVFAVAACVILSLLLPVASPLFFSLFFGVIIRESGIKQFIELLQGPVLYLSTMFLGLTLGTLCDAKTILNPTVLKILVFGFTSLILSGVGGVIGGYFMYLITGKKYNPVIGIAGVSCVPTTAKVAQKIVTKANPLAVVMPQALGVNVSGVITSAIIAGVLISILF